MSLLEKDKIMLQHRFTECQRKADQEAEKRRNLENEGKDNDVLLTYISDTSATKVELQSEVEMQSLFEFDFATKDQGGLTVSC